MLNTPFRIPHLEAKYATQIKEFDKRVHDYHSHPCLCCEQQFKRSQVAEVDVHHFKETNVWLQIVAYAIPK